jgi:hypothetical protein
MKEVTEECDQQRAASAERGEEGIICGGGPGPYDFRIEDGHGTSLEVEYGERQRVYIINLCEQENRSSMFITSDKEKLRAFRDAITTMLDNT